jgi:3-deoxy-D-manno-octulosonate 8-phosphate phosphatase (KDO 8-P phosphatase)
MSTHPPARKTSPLAQTFPPELLLQAQGIRIAFFDVDGVFTDGGLYFSESGESHKRFNVLDGLGLKLLAQAGVEVAVITGRDSPALRNRIKALSIQHVHYGTDDKRPAAEATLAKLGLQWDEAACMGDDWPDLPLLTRCQFACAPANAHVEVKARVHYVTRQTGGHGAVRELCDLLLTARGRYASLLEAYTA